MMKDKVIQSFRQQFGRMPSVVVRAPGRVNLIGEHTDYNAGFVLPMAIERAVWIALEPLEAKRVEVYSLDYYDGVVFDPGAPHKEQHHWGEYVKGVAWALSEKGYKLHGWRGVVSGDVPVGAGLSSSAALELATARAFAAVSDLAWDEKAMALLGQMAENRWVGVNCGIMDQLISAAGREGYALLIDCRSLETKQVPLPQATTVVVLDTATRRGLEGSAYNERRAQCEAGARFFGAEFLRDVSVSQFETRAGELEEPTRRRVRHVVTENDRTERAAEALLVGDARQFGELMNASHTSLANDFEVSNEQLNVMVECAQAKASCYGARMTGAGFGGCAVALVEQAQVQSFVEEVSREYRDKTGLAPSLYISRASEGASVVSI